MGVDGRFHDQVKAFADDDFGSMRHSQGSVGPQTQGARGCVVTNGYLLHKRGLVRWLPKEFGDEEWAMFQYSKAKDIGDDWKMLEEFVSSDAHVQLSECHMNISTDTFLKFGNKCPASGLRGALVSEALSRHMVKKAIIETTQGFTFRLECPIGC